MSIILTRGKVPPTPHTEFYFFEGVLALEEIHGSFGFSGPWSRKMHVRHYPTEQSQRPSIADFQFEHSAIESASPLEPMMIQTEEIPYHADALRGRTQLLYGPATRVSTLKANSGFEKEEFFRNGEYHELFYFQEGEGVLESEYGNVPFKPEDYLLIPKGTTYRIELRSEKVFALLIESTFPIEWPEHYRNQAGQNHMTAPVVETEIVEPTLPTPIDEKGDYPVFVQHSGGKVTKTVLSHHPFDVCGWEGALYPFAFPIRSHHGIAREIHTAPPAHQTFQAGTVPLNGFSLCSFVPQMEGWHPKEVPAPYAHSNVDSDEVMFFCNTSYGARKGVLRPGSLTFHPGALPHSPHGLAAERSLSNRSKMNERLAVMFDTYFESLAPTEDALQFGEKDYWKSWQEARDQSS